MPTCYLVIGTPRSGTSMVAGVLHKLGVIMGERIGDNPDGSPRYDFDDPDDWNIKGYFQDAAFVNLFQEAYGFVFPDTAPALSATLRQRLRALVAARNAAAVAAGTDWGVKEPHLAYCLPQFVNACQLVGTTVKIIATQRDVARSAASWAFRTGDDLTEATRKINAVRTRAVAAFQAGGFSTANGNLIVGNFDDFIERPRVAVRVLAAFVGRPSNEDAETFPDGTLVTQ